MTTHSELWGSGRLFDWIRGGGRPTRPSKLSSRLYSRLFDLCAGLQAQMEPPPPLAEQPLFILGLWRSGTTYLHELLAELPGLGAPRTWQCMNPASFRIMGRPTAGRTEVRPMDQVSVSALSPQEDEFALLLAGEPSLYRMFLDPRRVDEILALLDGPVPARLLKTLDGFLRTASLHEEGSRLVVKSPGHIFRVAGLAEAYPLSPFVFLVRDVESLFESNVRMWTEMARRHSLWEVSAAQIEAFVIRSLDAAADRFGAFAADRQLMSRAAVCTYDALRAAPLETVSALLDRVGLHSGELIGRAAMQARIDQAYVPRSRGDGLPPAAQRMGDRLREAQAALVAAGTPAGVD